ncbi:hypothetical protein CAPTEDRAFT_186579 [Capitella teleta]|uniref:Uncharacterized protein n=1 Tax=Capitella teleta TaxID=283909 RepID=R7UCR0_CAPTE|nr:hypothetical protein CAPTEDRAFT_186579 [Capitella teleta]|eukprot:ELU01032.1 hypothetical protein CAPTEDRAFT_186579 [Capitella teleta]
MADSPRQPEPIPQDTLLAGEFAIKETEHQQKSLTHAKDRSQFTSTTAMSVLNIAVLKQFLVGVILLLIANRRSFLEKYGEQSKQSLFENICHCKLVRRENKKKKKKKKYKHRTQRTIAISSINDVTDGAHPGAVSIEMQPTRIVDDDESDDDRCCAWKCTTQIYKDFEDDIINHYEDFAPTMIDTELKMVAMSQENVFLGKRIDGLKTEKSRLEGLLKDAVAKGDASSGTKDDTGVTLEEQLQANLEVMADLQLKHTKNEEYLNHGKIQHDQIKLLYTYVEAITKNRVLKNTTFWQNTTNYLLYIIFVLNAFITGFGIATPSGTESESAVFNISALSQR